MTPTNIACGIIGFGLGLSTWLGQITPPPKSNCTTYKVAEKPVTAYVLNPPPPVVVHEKCPTPIAQLEVQKTSDINVESDKEEKPRHRRRRWRR